MRSEPDAARIPTLRGLASFAVAAAAAVVVARVAPMSFGVEHALFTGLIFATAASAWGLFAGFGGQFSFGHAALFGLTPYGAVLAGQWWGVPALPGVLATAALVAVVSLLIVGPSLRLRGPFFALVTLALAEIARQWVNEQRDVTGGEGGMLIDPTGTGLLHLEDLGARGYMAVAVVLLAVTLAVNWTLVRSRLGYQLTALRDDQDIAATTGIDTARTKIVTYLVSAFFTGLAGGVYAYSSGIVASDALLGPAISIAILIYAGVGGMRSVFGPAIGAMVLVAVEEALRIWVGSSAPSVYQIAFSTLFVIALFALPGGLVSLPTRLRDRSARTARTARPGEAGDETASAPLREVSAAHIRDLLDDLRELERQVEGDKLQQVDLRVESLRKAFGGLTVTRDVDLTVPAGASVGIWGHNGSGKSTLLNQVGGQLAPDAGHIWLGSRRIEDMPVHRRARLGIVRASQQATVYETHSVQDNLLATLYTTKTLNPLRERDHHRAIEFVGRAVAAVGLPTESLPKPAADLSTGQRKRLEIARLLVGYRPRVMLLDEPTAGIDRHGVGHMADILTALRTGTGATMIVVDHDEDFLTAATSTIVCLSHGRVIDTIDVSSDEVTERLGRAVVAGGAGA